MNKITHRFQFIKTAIPNPPKSAKAIFGETRFTLALIFSTKLFKPPNPSRPWWTTSLSRQDSEKGACLKGHSQCVETLQLRRVASQTAQLASHDRKAPVTQQRATVRTDKKLS